jgi:glycosyltransferase involved in cell wall biosynthesis
MHVPPQAGLADWIPNDASSTALQPMVYVILSTQIWTDNWVSKHWIAHWLAELGHEVYFIEPLRALLPGRGGRPGDLLAGPKIRKVGKVNVVSFTSLPFYYRIPSLIRPIWRLALKSQFRRFSEILRKKPFDLITFDGRSLPLIKMLPRARRTAYYSVDPVGIGEDRGQSETRLVATVDRVLAISSPARDFFVRTTGRDDVVVIPHGIDFKRQSEPAEPHALAPLDEAFWSLPNLIGYTGSIHDVYVDFDKIHKAAVSHPHWTFVFVGPHKGSDIAQDASRKIQPLMALPNVHFAGSKPYQALRQYIERFDACIIPYRADVDNGWERKSPVKMLHYLALGKPVVCSDVPGALEYRELIHTYSDYDGFVACIEAALDEAPDAPVRHARIELAASRDCDIIVQQLLDALDQPAAR